MGGRSKGTRPLENPQRGLSERYYPLCRRLGRTRFDISSVYPNGRAPGEIAGFNVPPAISDKETGAKVQPVFGGSLEQQAGFGLAAIASIPVVVITDQEVINWQRCAEFGVHALDHVALLRAARHVRLVGYDKE